MVMTTEEMDTEETAMDAERKVMEEGIVMNLMAPDVTVIMTTTGMTDLTATMNVVSTADQRSTKQ